MRRKLLIGYNFFYIGLVLGYLMRRISITLVSLSTAFFGLTCSVALAFDEAKWQGHTQAGASAFQDMRYGEALKEFSSALEESKNKCNNDLFQAISLTNLGTLHQTRGNLDKAQPLFEQAVRIRQKALGPFNTEVVDSVAKLCHFYIARKENLKAETVGEQIINFGEQRNKELEAMNSGFKNLNAFYSKHPNLKDASSMLEKAKSMTEGKVKSEYLDLAVMFDSLGTAYRGIKDDKAQLEAEKLYKMALNIRERFLHGNHLGLSSSLENLGKLYQGQGQHEKAVTYLQKAYDISLKSVGMSHPQTYSKLDALAISLSSSGKAQEAESLYRQALASFEKTHGQNSGYVASVLESLANMKESHGHHVEAANYLSRELKIKQHLNGPHHASVSEITEKRNYLLKQSQGAVKTKTKEI